MFPTAPQKVASSPAIPFNQGKKRKPSDIKNSSYAKIRLLVHELRPHFLQVLREPDFQNSEAALAIRKGMKQVMDLYKNMQTEGNMMGKVEVPSCQPLGVENSNDKRDGLLKKAAQEGVAEKYVDHKLSSLSINAGETPDDTWPRNSYIAGGSTSDRNFVTFVNRIPPEYYGVTKESFRLCHRKA